jgi:hypothetical protein
VISTPLNAGFGSEQAAKPSNEATRVKTDKHLNHGAKKLLLLSMTKFE